MFARAHSNKRTGPCAQADAGRAVAAGIGLLPFAPADWADIVDAATIPLAFDLLATRHRQMIEQGGQGSFVTTTRARRADDLPRALWSRTLPSWRTSRCPPGHRPVTTGSPPPSKPRDEALQLETVGAGHSADFERERERADRLMAERLRATADTLCSKGSGGRLAGELSALRWPLWWRRLAG
jgi:hypothetical protein